MRNNIIKLLPFLELPFLNIGIPFLMCILFKIFDLGSIGPFVLLGGVIQFLVSPVLLFRLFFYILSEKLSTKFGLSVKCKFQNKIIKTLSISVIVLISLFAGSFIGVLGMNAFIGLTALFGIMDYDLI